MSFTVVVCDDGTVLPPDPLDGVEVPDLDDPSPEWLRRVPEPVVGQAPEVASALHEWEVAVAIRCQAEAAEAAAMLEAEAAFRADFALEFPGLDWYETGRKCFTADAGKIGRTGPRAASHRLESMRLTRDGLPTVWDMFMAGRVSLRQVETVASDADGLDAETRAAYDTACAAALEKQPGSRLARLVAGIRERVQARTADERHARASADRDLRLEPGRDGMGRLTLEGPIPRLAAISQAAHRAAVAARGHEGETRSIAALKFDVVEDLILDGFAMTAAGVRDGLLVAGPDTPQRQQAVPQRRQVVPTVILHVPVLTLLGRSDELPTLDGVGPISAVQARELCAVAPSFFRVLTHPVTGARLTLDRTTYSPPADLRRWIQVRDEYSRFPGSLTPAHLSDIDHVREWHDAGVTNDDNLVALSRDKHVLKSMGLYTVDGDPNGELTFTSPMGVRHVSTPRPPAAPVRDLPDACPF